MNLLIDTHCLIWAALEAKKLSARVRGLLIDPANTVQVSSISFWEISLFHHASLCAVCHRMGIPLVSTGRRQDRKQRRAGSSGEDDIPAKLGWIDLATAT